ncbi:MAG: hypothetical protein SAJ37_04970 [Oscillatoria sp. PMC 1068.18]|nr:hypothetical protein [Oscillatoria sp. PMC 1076.18]MEC4988081.1 hypothetical protein [Oscillatoria sp. PMC 1068.18]
MDLTRTEFLKQGDRQIGIISPSIYAKVVGAFFKEKIKLTHS